MQIFFIRHGMTKGNLEKRYIGAIDETLCQEGIEQLKEKERLSKDIPTDAVFWLSPMKRCLQTATVLFPDRIKEEELASNSFIPQKKVQIESQLRECNFGNWEGKNYLDLSDDQEYQRWIDSGGTLSFPNGESVEQFKKRCVQAFLNIWNYEKRRGTKTIVFIVHGGTIMAILEQFGYPKGGYYDYQCKNGCGYCCNIEKNKEGKITLRVQREL